MSIYNSTSLSQLTCIKNRTESDLFGLLRDNGQHFEVAAENSILYHTILLRDINNFLHLIIICIIKVKPNKLNNMNVCLYDMHNKVFSVHMQLIDLLSKNVKK